LQFELLGGFRAAINGRPLEGFISNKAKGLLAYLFITRRPQSRQVLAEMFWGDKRDSVASTNLRVALSNLRSIAGSYLEFGRHEVGVNPAAPYTLDVAEFQTRLERLSSRWQDVDAQVLEEAVALYQGDLLDGFVVRDALSFEEWALWQRERLRQMALQGLYMLSMHQTERGNYDSALKATRRLLDLEPWQEEGHRQMMLLLALTGNRSAALAQYETCRRILASELDTAPLPETNALLERIKAAPQAAAGPDLSSQRPKTTLFGREQEFDWLLKQWAQVQQSRGRLSLVEGEMGIGKTRLIEETLHRIDQAATITLRARCHEFGSDLSFQPVIDLLRLGLAKQPDLLRRISPVWLPHLAIILPEAYDPSTATNGFPLPSAGGLTTLHLFEAVHQAVRALLTPADSLAPETARRLVIFLDDLHWIDTATVDLLRYLLPRVADLPIWLIGAYQQEGIDPEHPFLRLRSSLIVEDRASVLRLERLPNSAIVDWISAVPDVAENQRERLAEVVVRRGQGNPFITSQMLRDLSQLVAKPGYTNGQQVGSWLQQAAQIPFAVREVVLLKLNRLTPAARELLCEAAAIDEQFDLHALAWIEPQEPVAGLLGECLENGLITTIQPGVYKFTHPMMREVAAEWLSPWRRQRVGSRLNRFEPNLWSVNA
jgi:DNA-binding SARP family transcriptional activator